MTAIPEQKERHAHCWSIDYELIPAPHDGRPAPAEWVSRIFAYCACGEELTAAEIVQILNQSQFRVLRIDIGGITPSPHHQDLMKA